MLYDKQIHHHEMKPYFTKGSKFTNLFFNLDDRHHQNSRTTRKTEDIMQEFAKSFADIIQDYIKHVEQNRFPHHDEDESTFIEMPFIVANQKLHYYNAHDTPNARVLGILMLQIRKRTTTFHISVGFCRLFQYRNNQLLQEETDSYWRQTRTPHHAVFLGEKNLRIISQEYYNQFAIFEVASLERTNRREDILRKGRRIFRMIDDRLSPIPIQLDIRNFFHQPFLKEIL